MKSKKLISVSNFVQSKNSQNSIEDNPDMIKLISKIDCMKATKVYKRKENGSVGSLKTTETNSIWGDVFRSSVWFE